MNNIKRHGVYDSACVHSPVMVGDPVVFSFNGRFYRTSPVEKVCTQNGTAILVFETANTVYEFTNYTQQIH